MRRLLALLARGASGRAGRGLQSGPSPTCGHHHHQFGTSSSPSPPQSLPVPTTGAFSFDRLLRSWRPQRDADVGSGLLGLLPARCAVSSSSWERKLVAACGAARSTACSGAIVERGLRWMAFSLQKRPGLRAHDYYRRWNFWYREVIGVVWVLFSCSLSCTP